MGKQARRYVEIGCDELAPVGLSLSCKYHHKLKKYKPKYRISRQKIASNKITDKGSHTKDSTTCGNAQAVISAFESTSDAHGGKRTGIQAFTTSGMTKEDNADSPDADSSDADSPDVSPDKLNDIAANIDKSSETVSNPEKLDKPVAKPVQFSEKLVNVDRFIAQESDGHIDTEYTPNDLVEEGSGVLDATTFDTSPIRKHASTPSTGLLGVRSYSPTESQWSPDNPTQHHLKKISRSGLLKNTNPLIQPNSVRSHQSTLSRYFSTASQSHFHSPGHYHTDVKTPESNIQRNNGQAQNAPLVKKGGIRRANKECALPGCQRPAKGRYCGVACANLGATTVRLCAHDGCENRAPVGYGRYCASHVYRVAKNGVKRQNSVDKHDDIKKKKIR